VIAPALYPNRPLSGVENQPPPPGHSEEHSCDKGYVEAGNVLFAIGHFSFGHAYRVVSIRCGPRDGRLRSERESSARRAGEFDNGTAEGPHRRFLSAVKMSAGETRQPCQATRSIRVGCGQFHGRSAARSLIL